MHEVHRQRRRLPGQSRGGEYGAPTHDDDQKRFPDEQSILAWWHRHMTEHWEAGESERLRPELEEIVRGVREKDVDLSDGRLDRVLRRFKENKSAGDDDVPVNSR